MNFEEANKTIHRVEDHWSYSIMVKHGYEALNKEGVGFVRSFKYKKNDHEVTAITGANSDHWKDNKGNSGFWSDLENYLE